MTIRKPENLPQPTARWIEPDGKPTREFYLYLRDLDTRIRELIDAVNDHETRITTLEP